MLSYKRGKKGKEKDFFFGPSVNSPKSSIFILSYIFLSVLKSLFNSNKTIGRSSTNSTVAWLEMQNFPINIYHKFLHFPFTLSFDCFEISPNRLSTTNFFHIYWWYIYIYWILLSYIINWFTLLLLWGKKKKQCYTSIHEFHVQCLFHFLYQ